MVKMEIIVPIQSEKKYCPDFRRAEKTGGKVKIFKNDANTAFKRQRLPLATADSSDFFLEN